MAKKDKLSLEAKVDIAKVVIRDSLSRFNRPAAVWSAGKDSTTTLHLVLQVAREMGLDAPPALFIDHGDHFEETLSLVREISEKWGFRVIVARNDDFLSHVKGNAVRVEELNAVNRAEAARLGFQGEVIEYTLDTAVGNHLLKTVPMNDAITKYSLDCLFTGIRWDENPARSSEVFLSPRENPPHFRAQPILPFTERDIWNYIFKNNIPFHPKYREGFRSIDGKRDSQKVSDVPAWEQDLERTSERAGRAQNKERMMDSLRRYGYM